MIRMAKSKTIDFQLAAEFKKTFREIAKQTFGSMGHRLIGGLDI